MNKQVKRYKISEHGGLVQDENGPLVLFKDVEDVVSKVSAVAQGLKVLGTIRSNG